ncbi:MAG: S-layer homology domain-containing protein [Eubacteriales bacterium]|nr:S-layer homology domain-containing protein [Eubacteriales bacterium]
MRSQNKFRLVTGICSLSMALQMASPVLYATDTPADNLPDITTEMPTEITPILTQDTNTGEVIEINLNEIESTLEEDMIPVQANYNPSHLQNMPAPGTTVGSPFPKGTGQSNSFRIPALVTLPDGSLLAAADARWNTTYDGGGLDTIVSISEDNGENWAYHYANYLGDNGNVYNGRNSSCFIDPILAVDGENVYMLVDLYPYGVALNGTKDTNPSMETGFNEDGKLLLKKGYDFSYSYYLEGNKIYNSATGQADENYYVDEHFNIFGTTPQTSSVNTNLFFKDSPYKVQRTSYLYFTKSTDGGKNWSAPKLLPVKNDREWAYLVAPGRGLVTSEGKIIFPCYTYSGGDQTQRSDFIYSEDGGETWHRSTPATRHMWSSESAAVELKDGTLRFFFRNGNRRLHYVDYKDNQWGQPVNTGIPTNSNCQISALKFSKTIGGKEVIFVSNPVGRNGLGDNRSGAEYRLNGTIFVGLVDTNNQMEWKREHDIKVTQNNSQFMYSCLTELNDGKLGILYEYNQAGWGVGSDKYYEMTFKSYDLANLHFDKLNQAALSINTVPAKTYGDESFTLEVKGGSGDGAVTFESLNNEILSIDGNTATIHKAGTVSIQATKAGNDTYNEATATLELNIAKKALTVKANDITITEGEAIPAFTFSVNGLVGTDTFTEPAIVSNAPNNTTVGEFQITISEGTLSNAENYQVTYENATLRINKKAAPINNEPVTPYIPSAPSAPSKPKDDVITIESEKIPLSQPNSFKQNQSKKQKKVLEIKVETADDKEMKAALTQSQGSTVPTAERQELLITSSLISVAFDANLLNRLPKETSLSVKKEESTGLMGEAKVLIGDRGLYHVRMVNKEDKEVYDLTDTTLWLSIPYTLQEGESAQNIMAFQVNAQGMVESIANSFYDAAAQELLIQVKGGSKVAVGHKVSPTYSDIESHWAKQYIDFMSNRAVFTPNEKGEFMANHKIRREEFVSFLGKYEKVNPALYASTRFTDVPSNEFLPFIEWANKHNIVKGTSETTFSPESNISREQIAVMLVNYAKAMNILLPTAETKEFADQAQISDYAKESVMIMQSAGVLTGKDGNRFDPKGLTTKAEAATILYRFVNLILK